MSEQSTFTERLLRLVAELECYEAIWWNSSLEFFVPCNDSFAWACADAEPITESDLPMFTQAMADCEDNGPLLYCCRRRGMRPQGAMYQHLDRKDWPLFDACGPVRETGFGNPTPQPTA